FSIPFCRRGSQVQVAPPIADSRLPCSHVKTIPPHSYFVIRTSSFSRGSHVEIVPHPLVLRTSSLVLLNGSPSKVGSYKFVLRHSRRFIRRSASSPLSI